MESPQDKELIAKLSYLKQIKPKEEWVVLTRQRLFEQGAQEGLSRDPAELGFAALHEGRFWRMAERMGSLLKLMMRYGQRPAFAIPVLTVLVAGGAIGLSASESLPGDTLYPLKATAQQVPLFFSAQEERPHLEFVLAQQRLSDLRLVAEQNRVKNLPSAIQEFEANASRISEGFVAIVENQPERALQASRRIVQLQKEKSEVERILGTKIGEEQEDEIQDATRKLVEYELAYLETRSLTEEQEGLFEKAKQEAQDGDYPAALETIWALSQH